MKQNARAKAWALLYFVARVWTPSEQVRQLSHADFFYPKCCSGMEAAQKQKTMKKFLFSALSLPLIFSLEAQYLQNPPQADLQIHRKIARNVPASSLYFEENAGQVRDQNGRKRKDILFAGKSDGMAFFLRNDGISYQLIDNFPGQAGPSAGSSRFTVPASAKTDLFRVDSRWINPNPNIIVQRGEILPGHRNYYNVPAGEAPVLNVKSYKSVVCKNVWDGIDVRYFRTGNCLETDFLVAPGADYQQIRFRVDGADLSTDLHGNLSMKTPFGEIREGKLKVYQNGNLLASAWHIDGNNEVSFLVKDHNPALAMVIDPLTRVWGTYLGGDAEDRAADVQIDPSGNVLFTGVSYGGSAIATSGAHQTTFAGNQDCIVAKYTATGSLVWCTYLGGGNVDYGTAINCDNSGNIFVVGECRSGAGIATPGAHQESYGGNVRDGFLVKFNANGQRQWGTYLGGSGNDVCQDVAVDINGNAYMTGETSSTSGISSSGTHQSNFGGGSYDPFLVKFNTAGVRQWGTYCGGTGEELGNNVTVDNSGNIYLLGYAQGNSSGISTPGAFQEASGGLSDASIQKFNTEGIKQWGTYFGGSANEYGFGICLDQNNNLYISGITGSTNNISSPGAHQNTYGGGVSDGFLAKFSSSGARQWSTYYGGADRDETLNLSPDGSGNIYLTGLTSSTSGISTSGNYQSDFGGGNLDAYFVKFSSGGQRIWGSYYGGANEEAGRGISVSSAGQILLCGETASISSIASPGSAQSNYGGGSFDAFIARFSQNSDTCTVTVYDTIYTTVNDTITIYDTVTVSVDDTLKIMITGINPPLGTNVLKVWPNPGNTTITLDAGNLASMSNWKYKIINSSGQVVTSETSILLQQTQIDISSWQAGIYFLQILNPAGQLIEVKKILIAN